MTDKITGLLRGEGGNYIFPFFWVRGEDEETLRTYMRVIHEANIGAVCVESRPHPDFCGPKWWADMDVILDEAKRRGMKVWILDDSHFPTGYANGALEGHPDALYRQSVCCRVEHVESGCYTATREKLERPDEPEKTFMEKMIGAEPARVFDDDRLLAVYAVNAADGQQVDLMPLVGDGVLTWEAPEGSWKVYTLHLSRNMGYHRNYINMMSFPSCRVLIDAVYEPHWEHYKEEFGKTIAGFFSDEPELGNGHIYDGNAGMGVEKLDYPWSDELMQELAKSLGVDYAKQLYLLWENDADADEKARVRYAYMDAVTRLVKKDFSYQLGDWCRAHGVKYIGHLIEDNNQYARTGSSLGHYFRGLAGQDYAGIDNIGGQVLPQGEDVNVSGKLFGNRIGEFFHYLMGKLASSAAAIEPLKEGNSMCEIFGAYGWEEGVRLEKYLLDHFMAKGINHFVPHAFSAAEYPDPDCPPHFYAHGNNPQYRHFGELMKYANRVCELISDGRHIAEIALLYHGEAEWTGKYVQDNQVAHVLTDSQLEFDIVPQEVFADRKAYHVSVEDGRLIVNTQRYRVFLIPSAQYVTKELASAVGEMTEAGVAVYVVGDYPAGICDSQENVPELLGKVQKAKQRTLSDVASAVAEAGARELSIALADNRIRYYHYEHKDGTGILFLVNEGTDVYAGKVQFADSRHAYLYDAWDNRLVKSDYADAFFSVTLEPLKSIVAVFSPKPLADVSDELGVGSLEGFAEVAPDGDVWRRSTCRSIDYPNFSGEKQIALPDALAEEEKYFSGFMRYENSFTAEEGKRYVLRITDAYEGVEVFVNGTSLGIQIVPAYVYDLTPAVHAGRNDLRIEVATTLQRENAQQPNRYGEQDTPRALSGITGEVHILMK